MKTHLLIGSRTACNCEMPKGAMMSINIKLITCKLCRRTKLFRQAESQNRAVSSRRREKLIQMELFDFNDLEKR